MDAINAIFVNIDRDDIVCHFMIDNVLDHKLRHMGMIKHAVDLNELLCVDIQSQITTGAIPSLFRSIPSD